MKDEPMILNTSDEAAKQKTVTGWVSRTGHFWGNDERMARWDGCTHIVCECGAPTTKHYTKCEVCREKIDIEKYEAKPKVEWDGTSMLFSEAHDRYFLDMDELMDFLEDEGDTIEEARVVICEPNYARPLESDRWCDDMADDEDAPDWLTDAIDAFNEAIKGKPPLSWSPGKNALAAPAPEQGKEYA